MMSMVVFFFVPAVVFLAIVAPLWIIFHYVTKWKTMKQHSVGEGMTSVPKEELQKLRETAKKLNERLTTLEKVLDHD